MILNNAKNLKKFLYQIKILISSHGLYKSRTISAKGTVYLFMQNTFITVFYTILYSLLYNTHATLFSIPYCVLCSKVNRRITNR